jgi:hypothetical protein
VVRHGRARTGRPAERAAGLDHYGSKSRRGTQITATLYSILETAELHGVHPAEYLYAAIVAADRGVVLMPWEFASARDAADSSSA